MAITTINVSPSNAFIVQSSAGVGYTLLSANIVTGVVTSTVLPAAATAFLTVRMQALLALLPGLSNTALQSLVRSLVSLQQFEGTCTITVTVSGSDCPIVLSGLSSPSNLAVAIPFSMNPPFAAGVDPNGTVASTSIAAFGSSPNGNGGSVTLGVITLQPADATNPGGISTLAQTLAGNKRFSGKVGIGTAPLEALDVASGGAMVRGSNAGLIGSSGVTIEYVTATGDGYLGAVDWTVAWKTTNLCGGSIVFQTSSAGAPQTLNTRGTIDNAGRLNMTGAIGAGNLGINSKTDSSGTPGNAVINKGAGKSAIALGASSCIITNSLITANTYVLITPIDRDATCKELVVTVAGGGGSFTVTGNGSATAILKFMWVIVAD